MELPKSGTIDVFATIVDINHFTRLVSDDEEGLAGQFVRDVLAGGVSAVQKVGGEVVGFMGDAFLALLPDAEAFFGAAVLIAKDLNEHCEWISLNQSDSEITAWSFAPGGASLKLMTEFGRLKINTITSRFLGEQRLFIGEAINYAARLGSAGEGNRCLLGPQAAKLVSEVGYGLDGPASIEGKEHENAFEYYELDLGDIWLAGPREDDGESYLA